jgi:signal transduction histidine kinase
MGPLTPSPDLSPDLRDLSRDLSNALAGILRSNSALRYQNGKLEHEIGRVSRIVFDEAMQLLAAAGLALGRATRGLPAGHRGNLDEVRNLFDRIEEQLEACASHLRPLVLEDLGLSAAIQSLCRGWQAVAETAGSAEIEIVGDAAVGLLPLECGTVLYRAVQEALTNAMRHAQASRVTIRLCEQDGEVQCTIHDDGIGFDPSGLLSGSAEPASGLVSIDESLRFIGGSLAIHSNSGGGTEIAITIRRNSAESLA